MRFTGVKGRMVSWVNLQERKRDREREKSGPVFYSGSMGDTNEPH